MSSSSEGPPATGPSTSAVAAVAPPPPAEVLEKRVATHAYDATDDDELTFVKGDIIEVLPFPDPEEQVCVYVCAAERERERKRKKEREGEREGGRERKRKKDILVCKYAHVFLCGCFLYQRLACMLSRLGLKAVAISSLCASVPPLFFSSIDA